MKMTALAGAVACGFAAVLVLLSFDPAHFAFYPVCQFHKLTALDCPGCGSLRAMHALLHGEWVAALHFNLLLVLSLPLFAWLGFRLIQRKIRGGPPPVIRPLWLWLYLAAWVAFGLLRNLPFPVFAAFKP